MKTLIDQIDNLLPQTQCGECHYPGCRPYATAIAEQAAPINQCPPGGKATVAALAQLLKISPVPELKQYRPPSLASIREDECIGCTKCIQACPVDAIIGAAKLMHVILADECTGCGLCVAPCPVDCIDLNPIDTPQYDKDKAKLRFNQRNNRLQQPQTPIRADKPTDIQATLARIKHKKS